MRLGPMELTLILATVVPWVLTIVALIDAIRVPSDSDYRAGSKVVWVLVILFLNCIGALIYYAVGKPRWNN
ncbi:MAG: PLDc N-terminal domain-containing protein [Actinomycetota bacterium]